MQIAFNVYIIIFHVSSHENGDQQKSPEPYGLRHYKNK